MNIRLGPVVGLATVAFLALLGRAAEELKVEGKTVELPEFKVTDSRALPEAPPWHYGRVGRFEVLSSTTEARTRKLLADFQKFQQALALLWPAPPKPLASSTLILCARPGEFASFTPPTPTPRRTRCPAACCATAKRWPSPSTSPPSAC
ncbi:hypothetical protein [Oleiharenicola sp. Vm1]|uniref:hypothetical protein n=1 Tax=Oleiharenicola sp. Vm1 TaxID=3398393 RepID=UPI0039F59369